MPKEIEQILQTVDYSWPKDAIIRYLYITPAPLFQRDLNYFLKSKEEQVEIYKKGFQKNGFQVVCSTLVDYYVEMYKQAGINAKKIIAINRIVPLFALIVEGEKGWYYLDPLKDLFNNQYGLKPTEYGILLSHRNSTLHNYPELVTLKKEYLTEIDDYLDISKTYLNNYFQNLHLQMASRTNARKLLGETSSPEEMIFKKIDFSNEHLLNLGQVTGLYERLQLHQFLTNQIYDHSEKQQISHRIITSDSSAQLNIGITPKNTKQLIVFEEINQNGKYMLQRKKCQ